ncbi:MAG: hypothetical protein OXU37_01725 [Thaumarchaeota archaeon]|nr:hypothetical protein [Nitrososphaerota archaeon]MDD9812984.1 hypothetical protein [Nitrososphaerota archaeon]
MNRNSDMAKYVRRKIRSAHADLITRDYVIRNAIIWPRALYDRAAHDRLVRRAEFWPRRRLEFWGLAARLLGAG